MRLIDADSLKEYYGKWSNKHTEFLKPEVDRYIDIQPTIDAVPVVRCKDCRYMTMKWKFRNCNVWGRLNVYGEEGFCHYGERKENV